MSFAFSDVNEPPERDEKIAEYEAEADKVNANYEMGLLTEEARRQELIDLWTECTAEVSKEVEEKFDPTSNLAIIVQSGARGNMMQINQIAGMRGLVANPKGEMIPRPVKSNYRDGLSVLEYFISQHGARKGLADTALRTAESGYLTRRLVDVSQDVIVREEDCGTKAGLPIRVAERDNDGNLVLVKAADGGPYSRLLAADVIDPADGQTVLYKRDDALSMDVLNDLVAHGVEEVKCRSVLTCESKRGVCAKCYGWSLATNKLVDVGETVGIVAAQSIGEPGTQLTLRSFHSGGVAAASDITQGLPRVTELFEARTPKGEAPITEFAGSIKIVENDRGRQIILTPDADSGAPKEDGVIKSIDLPGLQARAAQGCRRRPHQGRHPAGRRFCGPQEDPHHPRQARRPGQHRGGSAHRVPLPGCGYPRQAHRGHRAPDDPSRDHHRLRRHRPAAG